MLKFVCDWCEREFPWEQVSAVRVKNVFNRPARCHICHDCGRDHMPARLQDMLSWTKPR